MKQEKATKLIIFSQDVHILINLKFDIGNKLFNLFQGGDAISAVGR